MRKRNPCKDKVATITALWKADLPCAERKVWPALIVEGHEVNPWPGTANSNANGAHSCVRGQQAEAECNQNVEDGTTRLNILLRNILYSMQRSKTSEDDGE